MGLYINPPDTTKEEWLEENGLELREAPKVHRDGWANGPAYTVCLMQNPGFTAAGVCYSRRELVEFSDPQDLRHKRWFFVSEEKLREVCGPAFDAWVESA